MLFFFKFVFFFLFINLISSSSSNLIEVLSNDIRNETNVNSNIWVVLVAGSNGYFNYRHQADVLHAYQLISNVHKVPKERIILMMYDDIAWNDDNPLKGNVVNYPNGENLYTQDIVRDYTGQEVSPENFISVLTKDQKLIDQNKKVLNSTSDDKVFVYFSDHGAPSMISFPTGILSAKKFNKAITTMQETNSFGKLVIYIEACESGSMFVNELNPKKNVYALTASSFNEPSYAIFWDDLRKTYLADEFSINWILNSYEVDSENQEETLFKQFLVVKNKTTDSTVCEFGDLEMGKEYDTSDFQGKTDKSFNFIDKNKLIANEPRKPIRNDEVEYYLTKIHSDLNRDDSFERLVVGRRIISRFMGNLRNEFASKLNVEKTKLMGNKNKLDNLDCYDELLNYFHENCIQLHVHTYLFRHLNLFVNTCNTIQKLNRNIKVQELTEIINQHCSSMRNSFIDTKIV